MSSWFVCVVQTVVPGLCKNLLTGLGNKPDVKEIQLEMVCMDVLKVRPIFLGFSPASIANMILLRFL